MTIARRLIGYNLLSGIVLGVVGWYVGWYGAHAVVGPSLDYFGDIDYNELSVFLAYLGGVVGFLIGLGFLHYPIQRLRGYPPSLREKETEGIGRYFSLCTDHKVVGIQYLWGVGLFFFIGGLHAMLIRFQLLNPSREAFSAGSYLTIVGIHGTMMMGIMTSGILGPFANYLVPLMIGSRRMAFPRIESLTFWLLMSAATILQTTVFFGGFPTGWTGYAPLSNQSNPGMDCYILFFALVGISITLLGLNMCATIVTMRAPGMTWTRLPIFVWGALSTATLMVLAAPVLIAVLSMEALDRTAQTTFFVTAGGGSSYLYENLFWVFGHPEVYILALPGFGIVLELLPVFARKPLWGYRLAVAGMMGVALLSWFVWQHHLFVSGMNGDLRPFYMLSTELISIPTGFMFLCGMMTLWRGQIRFTVPMLFCCAWFFNFLLGGLSGVFLSDTPSDVTTHGSFFSMAHFHYTIMGGLVFAFFAGIYYWGPKMFGYELNERLGKIHFWTMFIFFNSTFMPLFAVGFLGQPRRVVTYSHALQLLNDWASFSAFLLGASMLVFLYNLVSSVFFKKIPAAANPWNSLSTEWQLPTPVPVHNFDKIPGVLERPVRLRRGPHPDPRTGRRTGREGLMAELAHEATDYDVVEGEPPEVMARNLTSAGYLLASASAFFFLAFVFAYFYLRSLNSNALWKPKGVDASVAWGTIVVACYVVSAVILRLGLVDHRANRRPAWRLKGLVGLLAGLAGLVLQVVAWTQQGFGPTDGGYASVYFGWTGFLFLFVLLTLFWMETTLATSYRYRAWADGAEVGAGEGSGDAYRSGSDIRDPVSLVRGELVALSFYWSFLAGIAVLTWIVLYLL